MFQSRFVHKMLPQMGPTDHRIHLGQVELLKASYENHSITKPSFSGPFFDPKRSPGQNVGLEAPKSDPWLQNPPSGTKKQKMRAEKPCRTPPSELRTEPYSAIYAQKPFWRVPSKSWHMLQEGKSCFQKGKSCFQEGKSCFQGGDKTKTAGGPQLSNRNFPGLRFFTEVGQEFSRSEASRR